MITLDKKTLYFIAIGIFVAISGFLYVAFFAPERNTPDPPMLNISDYIYEEIEEIEEIEASFEEHEIDEVNEEIEYSTTATVFISGQVNYPGVFELTTTSRIIDAVEQAGGVTAYADLNRINLALFVSDEQHIIIPSIYDEILETSLVGNSVQNVPQLININTADQQALQTLPGIGPVISQNIINHRNTHGAFTSIEQIQNVNQIGPNIFANIREMIIY